MFMNIVLAELMNSGNPQEALMEKGESRDIIQQLLLLLYSFKCSSCNENFEQLES